ncbi:hypothetical protein TRIP_B170100 [uncultured Desulfatiglans sp.]|nr:hypothetical protein TRIP_B170100 [uncultured Desulfatiglans sp.]
MNPLNPPIYSLFYHLNTLNGLLFTLDNQLQIFEKQYRESISQSSIDISDIFAGCRLLIRDLTEWPGEGLVRYYPSGRFSSKGEEYFEVIKIILARESAWTIAQSLEAFERFLKDISVNMLLNQQSIAEPEKLHNFESDRKSNCLKKSDTIFWKAYFEYHYKTNRDKLKFLRRICPDIGTAENNNNRVINLKDWFPVVEEVRHSATHSIFLIKKMRMKDWSKEKREILKKYFSGACTDEGYQLNISKENATFCLELFSEYSFQIYKYLSISNEYDWNILNKKTI